jgi:hypothetical protein
VYIFITQAKKQLQLKMSYSYDNYDEYDYDDNYDTYDHLYESNKATRRKNQKTNKWRYKTPTSSGTKKPAAKIFTTNGSPADIKAREQAKIVKRAREHKGTIELKHHIYDPYMLAYYENLQIDTETHPDYGYRPLCFNRQKLHFEHVKERLTYYNTYYNYDFGKNKYFYAWNPSVTDHYFSTHSPSLIKGTWRSVKPTECGTIQKVNLMNPKILRRKRAFWEMDEIDLNDPPYKLTKTFKTALLKPPLN